MVKHVAVACASVVAAFVGGASAGVASVVLVTGATGHTGSLLYAQLKQHQGVEVRAFVRNATKARDLLHCSKCDESEGIYQGDLTDKASVERAMQGVTTLAVATSAEPICPDFKNISSCYYNKGAFPVDLDFNGGKNQFAAFAAATAGKGHVVLCSSSGTTEPDNFLDMLGKGFISFYKLNEEAALMSYGLPYTIVKPCGLLDTPAGNATLTVSHDDEAKPNPPAISRGDVARVMAEAVLDPVRAAGLRFDLCSQAGAPTTDFSKLLDSARFPWDQPAEKIVV